MYDLDNIGKEFARNFTAALARGLDDDIMGELVQQLRQERNDCEASLREARRWARRMKQERDALLKANEDASAQLFLCLDLGIVTLAEVKAAYRSLTE